MRWRNRSEIGAVLAAVLFCGAAHGAAEPRTIDAVRTAKPPVIDGKLDDACWKAATPVGDFTKVNSDAPAECQTIARVAFDDAHLYIAMKCFDPDPKSITAQKLPHDGNIFSDDEVELMIVPLPGRDPYYQLAANAAGSTFDCKRTRGGAGEDDGWDGHWRAATTIGDDGWSIEMAIPFNAIAMTAKVGPTWALNLCRNKHKPRELSSIARAPHFNVLDTFATLRGLDVDFDKYLIGIGDVQAALTFDAGKPKLNYHTVLTNATGKPRSVVVEIRSKGRDKSIPLELPGPEGVTIPLGSVAAVTQQAPGVVRVVPAAAIEVTEIVVRDAESKEVLAIRKPQFPTMREGLRIRLPADGVEIGETIEIQVGSSVDANIRSASTLELLVRREGGSEVGVPMGIVGPQATASLRLAIDSESWAGRWGRCSVEATLADAAGKTLLSARDSFNVRPTGKQRVVRLNNLVSELANGRDRGTLERDTIEFLNPRDGWIFASVEADGKVELQLDKAMAPLLVREKGAAGPAETMRWLPAGRYTLGVNRLGNATLTQLIIRAIPELHYSQFQANPHVTPHGPYDWQFLSKHVLPHVNTIMASATDKYNDYVEQWTTRGGKWIVHGSLPGLRADDFSDTERCHKVWTGSIGMQHPRMGGVIVDEFGGQSAAQYQAYTEAVSRIAADPTFRGKWIYPYCAPIHVWESGRRFMRAVLDAGYPFAFERYLPEQRTEERAREFIREQLVEAAAGWEDSLPGSMRHALIVLGYMSHPTESVNVNPGVDFKVYMDMQFHVLANDPVFQGAYGIQEYLSSYCDEENVRWAARLYRHYGIEGNTARCTDDPYVLPHLTNADFEKGTDGWTVEPAAAGSAKTHKMDAYSWLQGRYPQTSQGDTFLLTERSAEAPNVIRQRIKALEPGRLYSLKLFTADYGDLSTGKSHKKTNAVTIRLEGADELPGGFQFTVPNCYSHEVGAFDSSHNAWMNYHWRVFRAKAAAADLTITDWESDTKPGGPIGQQLMFNFVEVQPYFQ